MLFVTLWEKSSLELPVSTAPHTHYISDMERKGRRSQKGREEAIHS